MTPLKYILATTLGGAFTALVGYLVYKWRARVDVQTRQDTTRIEQRAKEEDLSLRARAAALEAQGEPLHLLKEMLDRREAELADERKQCRQERDESLKTLSAIRVAMETIVKDLAAHREEESSRSNGVHDQLKQLGDRLLVIETELGVKKKVA